MIDLSHPIESGMQVYPGDPEVAVDLALTREQHGVAVSRITLGSHTGTHVDAPSHVMANGRTMSEVSVDELVGEALVIRVRDALPLERIDVSRLERAGLHGTSRITRIVLIDTGWCTHYGTAEYLRRPCLTREAARWLMDMGMQVLGRDGLIVENLRGLSRVNELARVGFFPLPLSGADGAPVRALALA